MGILRYGEKRLEGIDADQKVIAVKKIGWKRIARNTCRFGWAYVNPDSDSNEIIEPFSKKGKTMVKLNFVRVDSVVARSPSVRVHEFFYNLIFLLRRVVAFLLPILLLAGIVLSIIKREEGVKTAVIVCAIAFFVWIACIIAEGIIARCAESKLKNPSKRTTVQKRKTQKQKSSNNRLNDVPDDDDDLVTLKGQNGEDIDFVEIAGIAYRGNFYAILQPVELLDGMEDNEALVFKVTRGSDGEDKFEVELDDATIDAVFAEYHRLLDEAESKGY